MKYLLIIFSLAAVLSVLADNPTVLKDAPVCVQPPRKHRPHAKKPVVPEKCTQVTNNIENKNITINLPEEGPKKNSVAVLFGIGPKGISRTVSGSVTTYEVDSGAVVGVEYTRHFLLLDVGAQVLFNSTMLMKLGWSY